MKSQDLFLRARLTKLDVARRQLATAIDLFFAGRDVVSVYSLATNAWEVVDVLCRKAGVASFSVQARENVPAGKDLKLSYINSPYRNFLKHADADSEKTLPPLPDSQVEGVLFLAVEDYMRLNGRSPLQFQVFQLWYLAKYQEKMALGFPDELMDGVVAAFPGLSFLPRSAQLAQGARVLSDAASDQGIIGDPKTELAFQ